ncbi:hypothetical protein [Streptomyces hoynatensis]|uniref:hypothetical protein n=1 Tax=Streptomyces hoynatensis TaxID=1141874 RepID=UPI0011C4014D|nr:hypothetical protein [Streptomyces hoynatensis]
MSTLQTAATLATMAVALVGVPATFIQARASSRAAQAALANAQAALKAADGTHKSAEATRTAPLERDRRDWQRKAAADFLDATHTFYDSLGKLFTHNSILRLWPDEQSREDAARAEREFGLRFNETRDLLKGINRCGTVIDLEGPDSLIDFASRIVESGNLTLSLVNPLDLAIPNSSAALLVQESEEQRDAIFRAALRDFDEHVREFRQCAREYFNNT